jgi:hypothetical protein
MQLNDYILIGIILILGGSLYIMTKKEIQELKKDIKKIKEETYIKKMFD